MRIYISGPISGNPDFAEQFEDAAAIIAERGHEYINPAELGKVLPDAKWEDYMLIACKLLQQADAITMLAGWDKSKGARFEGVLAFVNRLPIYNMDADRFEEWWRYE